MNDHEHHGIDYVELTAPDLRAAREFYQDALGWAFTDYGPGYAGIHGTGDREAGGIAESADPVAPLVIVYSRDLEATLAGIVSAGGTTTPPYDFPGGRRFHFADPAGNQLAVWSEN